MGWKSSSGKLLYRVNDVIISASSENPSKYYGGTWELLCPGKTLVCIDTNDADFNVTKKTGGSKTVTLTTSQIPSHTHVQSEHSHSGNTSHGGGHRHDAYIKYDRPGPSTYGAMRLINQDASTASITTALAEGGAHYHSFSTNGVAPLINASGGSQAHSNLQPFMAVYMWIRVE